MIATSESFCNNVFMSPNLSANLNFVGQLVDNNCKIHFDYDNCHVQNQESSIGESDRKGPKMGHLFPRQFSIHMSISFSYTALVNNSHVWHKKLGHSNSIVLTYLMKHIYLGNKDLF
ncbi:hypothetical protein NC653_008232 [Populus alba x Populus x berolinensis]|uniref:GAG-pre-integrase domain-containing protein n=1 Tax=Populus alba x Populus x berolinensis TaxID=444605 RepID=A0AAD6R5X0_9ROSI|nr:hypothetical protein NC653_008232 [Populus alba x Populus x berolinensis]